MQKKFPFYFQENDIWCGPAVCQMALAKFGIKRSQKSLAKSLRTSKPWGTQNRAVAAELRRAGLCCESRTNTGFNEIKSWLKKNAVIIVNYLEPDDNEGHFAILKDFNKTHVFLTDPWHGPNFKLDKKEFVARWWNKKRTLKRWALAVFKT